MSEHKETVKASEVGSLEDVLGKDDPLFQPDQTPTRSTEGEVPADEGPGVGNCNTCGADSLEWVGMNPASLQCSNPDCEMNLPTEGEGEICPGRDNLPHSYAIYGECWACGKRDPKLQPRSKSRSEGEGVERERIIEVFDDHVMRCSTIPGYDGGVMVDDVKKAADLLRAAGESREPVMPEDAGSYECSIIDDLRNCGVVLLSEVVEEALSAPVREPAEIHEPTYLHRVYWKDGSVTEGIARISEEAFDFDKVERQEPMFDAPKPEEGDDG